MGAELAEPQTLAGQRAGSGIKSDYLASGRVEDGTIKCRRMASYISSSGVQYGLILSAAAAGSVAYLRRQEKG